MEKSRIEAYAELLVKTGVNPDPGQDVIVIAELDQPDFVRCVVEKFYQHGVRKVIVEWQDTAIAKLHQQYQNVETLSIVESWEIAKLEYRNQKLPALLYIESEDPDGMNGVDQAKRAKAQMARLSKIKPYRDAMENKFQWCIAAVPGTAWAQKVFPELPPQEAVEKLWETILAASRANGDPQANWKLHNQTVKQRYEKLNALKLAALEYKSANGTDFRVGLMENGVFAGGAETDLSNRVFNPNIPSEEIFTTPKRGIAEGTLVSTKPLSWQGTLIENFSVRFAGGKAVEVHAEKGLDALQKMIAMDEGAAYLGECALIGKNSPINNTGILFYNTLFDENASCHVALGRGFDICVRDFEKYSQEELHQQGVNDSIIHVDFMIGSDDLSIDGITADGKRIAVFRDGDWCF